MGYDKDMKYFFVLGSNPALSVAELAAVLDLRGARLLAPDFLLWETSTELDPIRLINRLGGTIKIGRVASEGLSEKDLLTKMFSLAAAKQKEDPDGKFNFGLSDYGPKAFNKNKLGNELKEYFRREGISSRFVTSREKTLSSVVVEQNKLLRRGIEIIIFEHQGHSYCGETLAVQPFKDLSRRDYGRPARDDESGMLPPKLAQVMINLAVLADPEAVIVDPFCGSGTILTEAALMSYKKLFGSDVSPKAIEDTRKNMEWMKAKYGLEDCKLKLQIKNVTALSKFIKAGYADAVITEPYLGPQRGRIDFRAITKNLEELYSIAISEFTKILKPGGRVVMVWPLFYGQKPISPSLGALKIIDIIPSFLKDGKILKQTSRQTIIYGRPNQKVYREIVVLEK